MNSAFTRQDIAFDSHGSVCRGWLFAPESAAQTPAPCIILAHGLGGTCDSGLESFAAHFAQHGFVALVFDYRHFGHSEGMPRQLLHIGKQQQDWQAALKFARTLALVNPDKVGLWGTSFSGGHVLNLAAKDPRVAAVCAQNPMVDGLAASFAMARYAGFWKLAQLGFYGVMDQIGAWLGFRPLMIPIVEREGTLAGLSNKGALTAYLAIVGPTWVNQMTARMAATLMMYRPIRFAKNIRCKTLLQAGRRDVVTPSIDAQEFVKKAGLPHVGIALYDMDHFDFYTGDSQQLVLRDQVRFFHRALRR